MEAFSFIVVAIRLLLVAINLTGNSLVLITIFKRKSLQGPTTYLLSNLAVTDLLLGFIIVKQYQGLGLGEDEMEKNDPAWKWKEKTEFYGRALSSSWTLVAIAIERYLAVMKPFYHRVHVTRRKLLRIILVIWCFVVVLIMPGYLLKLSYKQMEFSFHGNTTCNCTKNITVNVTRGLSDNHSLTDSSKRLMLGYETFLVVLCTALPAALVGYLYGRIIYSVWFKKVSQQGTNSAILKARRKLTKLLLTVTVVFYLCWLPLFVILSGQITREVENVCVLFPLLSTALNPIIYSLHSKPFRRGIKSLFTCCCRIKKNGKKKRTRDDYHAPKSRSCCFCCWYRSWTVFRENGGKNFNGLENKGMSILENPRTYKRTITSTVNSKSSIITLRTLKLDEK